jgi:C-terminal processing protease CtpA/Prc
MVPSFASINNEAGSRFALELQRMIEAVDAGDLAGWIVDLRTNGGGNMWPMIAGLGPVVGDGLLGAFVGPAGRNSWRTEWWYENGTAGERDPQTDQRSQNGYAISVGDRPYRLLNPGPAVAVLTGQQTGSSGEAVCVAFRGRPRTRSFGAATAGLSTSNSLFSLSDGAVLALTVAVMADRTGRVYGDAIEPDEVVVGKRKRNIAEDPAVLAASAWLRGG